MTKKRSRSKQKGSSFERKTCWALSRFIDPNTTETLFWRSAMSGGRATVQAKKGIKNTTQAGDITCIDSLGSWLTNDFVIECKHYKKLELENFFVKQKGLLWRFWQQLRKLCRKLNKKPLLIVKQNNTPTLLITNEAGKVNLNAMGAIGSSRVIVYSNNREIHVGYFEEIFR